MSLLLDALKEAQKQRQSDDGAQQIGTESPSAEDELEFELELDLENIAEADSDLSNTGPESTRVEAEVLTETSQSDSNHASADDKVAPESILKVTAPSPLKHEPGEALNKTLIESPHSANAVFRNRNRLNKKRYLLLVLILACLSLLAIGAYLYFLTESFSPASQTVLPRAMSIQPTETPTAKAAVSALNGSTSSVEKLVTEPVMTAVVPKVVAAKHIDSDQREDEAATVRNKDAVTVANESDLETESLAKPLIDARDQKNLTATVTESFSAEESFTGIKIRKRRIPAQREISLRRAQRAMASGDLVGAESNYGSVLKASPTNIVALLGMANLSATKGQHDRAQFYYQGVLAQSPENLNARAGLLNLASSASLDVGSALQQLLRESPEKPFLHASLGDYYLKRGEWSAAQAAYFDAFSRDPKNANYAYNLAISLDQMAKPKLALQFYQQALSLEKARPAHFDKAVLVARITVLKAAQR